MSRWQRLALAATTIALAMSALAADPTADGKATPAEEALPIDADWQARSFAYFTSPDPKQRRKEMRKATRALKQPCRYCHTPDFKNYTAKRKIAQQMMALSIENGVDCADCHVGKSEMTPLGKKSIPMWEIAREKGVFCNACHQPKTKFVELTDRGETFKAEMKKK